MLAASLSFSLLALESVLSGVFDGSEPTTGALPGGRGSPNPLAYQEVDFQVEASGEYDVAYDSLSLCEELTLVPGQPGPL